MINTTFTKKNVTEMQEALGDVIISCLGCDLNLVQFIILQQTEILNIIQAVCPQCGERTFTKKVKGSGRIGSCSDEIEISDIKMNIDTKDKNITHILVELVHGKK